MFLIVGGEGSSNRNASRDESVEAGDKSVEAGDESVEVGEKTPQSCYNTDPGPVIKLSYFNIHPVYLLYEYIKIYTFMEYMASNWI